MSIPKKIHYCWFGRNPLPQMAIRCIESWKKYCPDYEIIEWNEENFPIDKWNYAAEAYNEKKWAFVSDVARLYALVEYGGIYMDTDVEVIKPLDDLLIYEAVSGFESLTEIPTGLMGCEKGNRMFKEFLEDYENEHFIDENGEQNLTTNVERITKTCQKYGFVGNNTLQIINGFTLLPKDYLCPKNYITKEIELTENTFVIHHFDGSWFTEQIKFTNQMTDKMAKYMPYRMASYISTFISDLKYKGIKKAIIKLVRWLKNKLNERI